MCTVLFLVVSNEISLISSIWAACMHFPYGRMTCVTMYIITLLVQGVLPFMYFWVAPVSSIYKSKVVVGWVTTTVIMIIDNII